MKRNYGTVAEAYARLGVTPEEVHAVPKVTHHLRRLAKLIKVRDENVPRDPLYYLLASDDPLVRRVLEARDSLPHTLSRMLPWEAFCVRAEVPPMRLVEAMTDVCKVMSRQFSQVIAAVAHPSVVEKTIEVALTDDGQKDREVLHKHAGFIAPPSEQRPVNVNVHANASATSQAAAIIPAPSSESTIRRLADRLNAARGLPPARELTALPASPAEELPVERLARRAVPVPVHASRAEDTGVAEIDEESPD